MKLTTIFFAAMASFAIAGPVAIPQETPTVATTIAIPENKLAPNATKVNTAEAARDCRQCDDFYRKCMSSTWCWYDPYACSRTCDLDTCRKFNHSCTSCGYTDKC